MLGVYMFGVFFFQLWTIFISCQFQERVRKIMRHPRYCLTHYPGISSSITNATLFSIPPMSPTLAHRSPYPCWRTTHAGTSPQHASYVTHARMSTTLAHQSRYHATKVNTPPTLARLSHMHTTHETHASTNSSLFLELLGIQLSF